MEHSARHTVIFTTVLCVVFSVIVSAASVSLKDRQQENRRLDKIKNVLSVAGLMQPGERLSREEITRRFESSLVPRLVDLETGSYVDGADALSFDQRRAARALAACDGRQCWLSLHTWSPLSPWSSARTGAFLGLRNCGCGGAFSRRSRAVGARV